jgi:hypothetical protein
MLKSFGVDGGGIGVGNRRPRFQLNETHSAIIV